jgi:hypothetical protein
MRTSPETDEMLYSRVLWRIVEPLKFWLKSAKSRGRFTWRPTWVSALWVADVIAKTVNTIDFNFVNGWRNFPSGNGTLAYSLVRFRLQWNLLLVIQKNQSGDLAHKKAERQRAYSKKADLVTRACDFECAEPSKIRPLSSVTITYVGGWRAETQRTASDWSWLAHEGTWL